MEAIKSYTNLEQSKKLAEILPIESADMWYQHTGFSIKDGSERPIYFPMVIRDCESDEDIPCWSLTALLEILDYPQLSRDKLGSGKVGWMVSAYPDNCRYDSSWYSNPVEACCELILKLHELNLL